MYDLKITGGSILDGTGRAAFSGDLAIHEGRIVAVGDCPGPARRELKADGALVTPGFVDIHTHYDGQATWDETLAPTSLHGVTTCVAGNCGVGFAPVRPGDHQRLIDLMEGVEDIPGSALAEGLRWGWESFPEYLDALARLPRSIDLLAQVPHDPLRVYVMGERALRQEAATDDDIAAMQQLLRASLEAGAVGFSTGRTDNHRSAQGHHTPAAEATARELEGLARAFAGLGRGVIQAVSDFDMGQGEARFDPEFDLLEGMARASGRPLSVSTMQRDQAPGQWRRILARAEAAQQQGLTIRCQVAARAIGVLLGLEATFHPFIGFPSYRSISRLPLDARVRAMRDPAFRAKLLQEKNEPISGDGSPVPPLADQLLAQMEWIAWRLFSLGERPNYEPSIEDSLGAAANRAGLPVMEALYDALLAQEGKALLYFPLYNYGEGNLDQLREMLTHPLALLGLSDGGAHVGTVCDASFPTFLLTHWGRDRAHGRLPLERLVKMQSYDNARFIGCTDRGALLPGMKADVNLIDLANLRLPPPVIRQDLPANGRRLVQGAEGILATLVAGEVIVENGTVTSARPGALVRAR